jgi:hypothetical protein
VVSRSVDHCLHSPLDRLLEVSLARVRVLFPEVSQPLSETPQSFPRLVTGRCGRFLDLLHLLCRQQIHARSQALHELLSSFELLLSPFPVGGDQRCVTGRLGVDRPLTLHVAALPQPGLEEGSVVPLRDTLRSLCRRLRRPAAHRRVTFHQVTARCRPLLCRECTRTAALCSIHLLKLLRPYHAAGVSAPSYP